MMNHLIMILLANIHYHFNLFKQVNINDKFNISHYYFSFFFFLGYRHVHLHTINGDVIANAYLFVHIVINTKSLVVVCFLILIYQGIYSYD